MDKDEKPFDSEEIGASDDKKSGEAETSENPNNTSRLWNWRTLRHRKPSDSYEKLLKNMIQRTLAGEIIPFDEFLDAEDELSEEPDRPPPSDKEIREASEAREWFLSQSRRFGLPVENRFLLCRTLYEKAAEPSQALLRLVCYVLCDTGVLLNMDPESHTPEEDAAGWNITRKDAEILYAELSARKKISVQFGELLKRLKKIRSAPTPGEFRDEPERNQRIRTIAEAYLRIFRPKEEQTQLSDNISVLLNIADANPDLAAVRPLFLYRVLTRHGKRLKNTSESRLDFRALWKYQNYKIDNDNGKNYRTYGQYLNLFEVLYNLFAADEDVDAPLCLYGFDHLSNLGDFYRLYPEEDQTLPFDLSVDELLLELECAFTCFEHGYEDNIMLEESGVSVRKLDRFQNSKDRDIQRTLRGIERYMNANLTQLLTRFLESDSAEQVRELCAEILKNAAPPDQSRPENKKQTALFLAAINNTLMEAADDLAEDYLTRACKILIGDYVEKKGDLS